MKSTYLILFTTIILFSCNKKKSKDGLFIFKSKKIEITYEALQLGNLKDNDILYIDNYKFIHKSNLFELHDSIGYFLPSKQNIIMKVENKTRTENGNVINISRAVVKNLQKTNDYKLINPQRTSLFGKVIFERKDGKEITIRLKKAYPASIKTD